MLELLELTCPMECAWLLKLRPGVLSKTLTPMWGKLNLPLFLFNVGLLTLMNIKVALSARDIELCTHSQSIPRQSALTPRVNNANRSPNDNSLEDPNPKWVISLSGKPLTQAERSVDPNFVVTPRRPPNLEYIMAMESVCSKLGQQDAEELRDEINRVLRSSPLNLT